MFTNFEPGTLFDKEHNMETFEFRTFWKYVTYWVLATLVILFSNYFGPYSNAAATVFVGLMAFMVSLNTINTKNSKLEDRIAPICIFVWAMVAASAFRYA